MPPTFQPVEWRGELAGFRLQIENIVFFYGTQRTQNLNEVFPQYEFTHLTQVHGARVTEATPEEKVEADGHWTSALRRAVVIQTADCLPLLLASPTRVAALHCGWRSVAANLIASTPRFSVRWAAVGPHIHPESFEVGEDVATQITPDWRRHARAGAPGKVFLDLEAVVRIQVREAFGPAVEWATCAYDTVRDPRFHSFRREKTRGRQYSFVVIDSAPKT